MDFSYSPRYSWSGEQGLAPSKCSLHVTESTRDPPPPLGVPEPASPREAPCSARACGLPVGTLQGAPRECWPSPSWDHTDFPGALLCAPSNLRLLFFSLQWPSLLSPTANHRPHLGPASRPRGCHPDEGPRAEWGPECSPSTCIHAPSVATVLPADWILWGQRWLLLWHRGCWRVKNREHERTYDTGCV